jgi:1-deoxy-D-xylulose-5-phosphate synthase
MKREVDNIFSLIPGIGKQVTDFKHRVEEAVKGIFVPGRIFEDFGFNYFGPIDGHDLESMVDTFNAIRKLKGPRIIHVVTKKGKGYKPAEDNPGPFHGTAPFIIETGEKKGKKKTSYTSIFGKTIVEIAEQDDKVIAVTAAMLDGTGLVEFAEKFPDRLFDVGIAEQHAITFSAGLASEGFKPVVAIYSTFLQRAYDQVAHDICNMNLPVSLAIDRAGIVGDDGATHQGVFDISFLRDFPNMTVMAPKDENELRHMIYTAVNHNGPASFRYPRGDVLGVPLDQDFKFLDIGKGELLREGNDIAIVAIGNRVYDALSAAEKLEKDGIHAAVINARFAKPLDVQLISEVSKVCGNILTVEENSLMGGFGSGVFESLRATGLGHLTGYSLGVPDNFVKHAPQSVGRKNFGLDTDGIYAKAVEILKSPKDTSTISHPRHVQ